MPKEKKNGGGQIRKGLLEFAVLAIISKGEAYASDIIENLNVHDLLIVEGTLYPLLNRLLKSGMVKYAWKESESGPPRKYYTLTSGGTKRISDLTKEWKKLKSSMNNLLKNNYE